MNAANRKFPMFASNHEGYAVIKEEIEEAVEECNLTVDNLEILRSVIRENGAGLESVSYIKDHAIKAAAEFIQVAAMCDKYLLSCQEDLKKIVKPNLTIIVVECEKPRW